MGRAPQRAPAQFPTIKLFPGNFLGGSERPVLCGEVREPAPCLLGTQRREAALKMMFLAAKPLCLEGLGLLLLSSTLRKEQKGAARPLSEPPTGLPMDL